MYYNKQRLYSCEKHTDYIILIIYIDYSRIIRVILSGMDLKVILKFTKLKPDVV